MRQSELETRKEAMKRPSLPLGIADVTSHAGRFIKDIYEKSNILPMVKNFIFGHMGAFRDRVAYLLREKVDRKISPTIAYISQRAAGLLAEEGYDKDNPDNNSKKRQESMEKYFPKESQHPEDVAFDSDQTLITREKEALEEVLKIEADNDLKRTADHWFRDRFSSGLNHLRKKYLGGSRKDLKLIDERSSGISSEQKDIFDAARIRAHEAIRQQTSQISGLRSLEYVYRPHIQSNNTDTPETFEKRNEKYFKERDDFGFEQLIFYGTDMDQMLYDADVYLERFFTGKEGYRKLNRSDMENIYIATSEQGEKKSLCIILTGKRTGTVPKEETIKTNKGVEELQSITTPQPRREFWETHYNNLKNESTAAQFTHKHLGMYYPACVIGQLEKSLESEFPGVTIDWVENLLDFQIAGKKQKHNAVKFSVRLPSSSRQPRSFIILPNGLICTQPMKAKRRSQSDGTENTDQIVMTWKEFLADMRPEEEAKTVAIGKSDEGVSKFGIKNGYFTIDPTTGLKELTPPLTDPTKDYMLPLDIRHPDSISKITIKTASGVEKEVVPSSAKTGQRGKYQIPSADISVLFPSRGLHRVQFFVDLRSGVSFEIKNIVINRP